MRHEWLRAATLAALLGAVAPGAPGAQGTAAPGAPGQGPGGRGGAPAGPPPTAEATSTVDLTGYWVSLVTEDWHWRMTVPEKGDVSSIPFTNDPEKRAILDAWDPAQDEAQGNQCRAYGAAAIMRVPTRVHISWESPDLLRLETDAGMQTRMFRFGDEATATPGERSWQGFSVAEWDPPAGGGRGGRGGRGRGGLPAGPPPGGPGAGPGGFPGGDTPAGPGALPDGPPPAAGGAGPLGRGRGGPAGPAVAGALKVITTNLRSGYLRKNGVPYSEDTTVTEYFHRTEEDYGDTYMIVTTIVEDPEFLTGPFITSSHFRKLPDTENGWNPTPCSVI